MKLGFIGTGNMANAIIGGIIQEGIVKPEEIIGSDVFEAGREKVKSQYGIEVTADNRQVAETADILFLSVKPQFYADVIAEVKDLINDSKVVITIAPGKTLAWLEEQFGKKVKIVRTMPNTPAMVGEGMTAACKNEMVTEEEMKLALKILNSFGKTEVVPERMIDAVVAVSGSSPAYVYIMIEAMADAAVAEGMPRAQAYKFAAQAVMGSAKMILETGKHPGELKDMVCSPAGTTIEAVRVLEEKGFRSALIEAMKACANVSRNL
ncbi:MAG: pyrroline-5-carboxylate reductase [Schaedlerella sp.]|nr:pyrroline-5-carboxylate reductase [Schaedlerella sp.]